MRFVLALCITIALCASADAAPRKREAPGPQAAPSGDVTPTGARVFRDNSVPGGWRTDHDDPPSPNDPSRRGSG